MKPHGDLPSGSKSRLADLFFTSAPVRTAGRRSRATTAFPESTEAARPRGAVGVHPRKEGDHARKALVQKQALATACRVVLGTNLLLLESLR